MTSKTKSEATLYRELSDRFSQQVLYLKYNNGLIKAARFVEDFEPIGETLIANMVESGIACRMVDRDAKIDDLMLVDFEHWQLRRVLSPKISTTTYGLRHFPRSPANHQPKKDPL